MRPRSPDLDHVLRQEHGCLRVRDHLALRGQVARAVARGELLRVFPGVVLAAGIAYDPEHVMVALRLWEPRAVLLGRSAAHLFRPGLVGLTGVDASVVRLPRHAAPPEVTLHAIQWPDPLVWGAGPWWFQTPAAAALWAAQHGDWALLTEGLRTNAFSVPRLLEARDLAPLGLRKAWRQVMVRAGRGPWSPAELDLHDFYRRAGLRGWKANHRLDFPTGGHCFLDSAFVESRVGVEVDSREHHSAPAAVEAGWIRHNRVESTGWRLLHVSPRRILSDPDGILAELIPLLSPRELGRLGGARRRRAGTGPAQPLRRPLGWGDLTA
ncbi:type IV toxin-antitoxin system AbiEi family antitoxin domain-containing protein [Aestuariimicrobium sp. T2.26MG-19.2B]|uniref:type IV toxin-antitoxin system AbiEi family antitoxin domain-containing protein n=1 Tax=Aestuariimicrobium sp. T2.26MG-19.2B TaxID=3040679 RepID=UPI002541920C|nr:type IV toxin-antitoxin system AbiEi family antitoxin domain-containing protein [Aestuariimicrobium sp. T2.26MG-19.2B]